MPLLADIVYFCIDLSALKKVLAFILSILYLTTSVGATVHFHYCMDKLVHWSLVANEEKICGNCGMHKEDSKGCCKDDHKQIKIQGEQKVASSFISEFNSPVILSLMSIPCYSFSASASLAVTLPVSNAPPDKAPIPVYLHNCVFRI